MIAEMPGFKNRTVKMKPTRSKHTPHRDLPTEVVEKRNNRERMRVTQVNQAFGRLQRLLPTIKHRTRRVSKERILQLAIQYIKGLRHLLEEDYTNQEPKEANHCFTTALGVYSSLSNFSPSGQQGNSTTDHLSSGEVNENLIGTMPFEACPLRTNGFFGQELRMRALEDALLSSDPIYADFRHQFESTSCHSFDGHTQASCDDTHVFTEKYQGSQFTQETFNDPTVTEDPGNYECVVS